MSRWRPRHLLAAWGVYWAALAGVVLGRPAQLAWRLANGPEGQGTASAGFENAVLHLRIADDAGHAWAGSAHLLTIALWVAGPPLLLWLLWLALRPRSAARGTAAPAAPAPAPALRGAGLDDVERAAAERGAGERSGGARVGGDRPR
jgi:hypothetical protein